MAENNNELMIILTQIERDKGITKEELLGMLESALASAFRKISGKKTEFQAHIEPDTGKIVAFEKKEVVEKVDNPATQISLEEAKQINPEIKIGEYIPVAVETREFERIAAQTAKQIIIQKIREKEKENLYKEFKMKEGKIIMGNVQKISPKKIIVDLGKTEGILPFSEQIPGEKFGVNQKVKALILKVNFEPKGVEVILSRVHPDFVRRIFETEVPEIADKTVEIKNIIREPGKRCKIAVISNNPQVDPIGACVGVKGSRIQAISKELNYEKIDLVRYSDIPSVYITNALTTNTSNSLKIISITLNEETKSAYVIVPNDQLSLAIGKGGLNVRLAAKLCGWHIDIRGESFQQETLEKFSEIKGVGEKLAKVLFENGYTSLEKIKEASVQDLQKIPGIGKNKAEKIYQDLHKENKEEGNESS